MQKKLSSLAMHLESPPHVMPKHLSLRQSSAVLAALPSMPQKNEPARMDGRMHDAYIDNKNERLENLKFLSCIDTYLIIFIPLSDFPVVPSHFTSHLLLETVLKKILSPLVALQPLVPSATICLPSTTWHVFSTHSTSPDQVPSLLQVLDVRESAGLYPFLHV